MNKIICIGAGGSTNVIIDIIKEHSDNLIVGILDDDEGLHQKNFGGFNIFGNINDIMNLCPSQYDEAIICVGATKDVENRKYIFNLLNSNNINLGSAISKNAILPNNILKCKALIVMSGVTINTGCRIGANVFINTGCIVEHDCIVEDNVFLSPGVILSGNVRVKRNSFVGSGSILSTGVEIGENVTLGAGSVVVRDIPNKVTATGNPAHKNIKNKKIMEK